MHVNAHRNLATGWPAKKQLRLDLFHDHIGPLQQGWRQIDSDRGGGRQIHDQLEIGRLLHR